MATNRTTKVVRVIVPTPAGTDAQTYAEVQLIAGSNVTLSTAATGNRAAVTIASTGGGGGGAPTSAEYLVKSSDATLSAERVVGSSSTIAPDWSTAGAVTFGVSVASEARGDLLMRGASAWGRFAPGTSGYALVSSGAGADLAWSRMQPYDAGALTSITAGTWTGAASITTVGTITAGTWQGASISTTYTDAKVVAVAGTTNRISIGGTTGNPTVDISASYVGQTSISTLGTVTTGTWSGTAIAVNKGGTGLVTYTAGDMLYATGTTTLGTTTSSATGRSIIALGAPPVGYVLGNSGSGLGWVALTVYFATTRPPELAFVIGHTTNPAAVVASAGTIGGP